MSWRHRPLAVAVAVSLLLHGLLLLALPLMSTRRQPVPAPLQVELLAAAGSKTGRSTVSAVSTHTRTMRSPISPPSTVPSVAPTTVLPVPSLSAPVGSRQTSVALPGAADAAAAPARSGADGEPGNASVSVVRAAIEPARFLGNARNPPYPERARALGLEGRVEVKVTVGAGGEVLNVELLRSSGQPELDRAALTLLGAGPYAPARRAGVAMASRLRIGVPYTLNK